MIENRIKCNPIPFGYNVVNFLAVSQTLYPGVLHLFHVLLFLQMTNEVGKAIFSRAGELGVPVGFMCMKVLHSFLLNSKAHKQKQNKNLAKNRNLFKNLF
jgi:hypothetical protein